MSLRAAVRSGDRESLGGLKQAASLWRAQGKHFSAGYAMQWAIRSAWGDPDEMSACVNAAIEEYKKSLETYHACAHETLLSLKKMSQLFWREYLVPSRAEELRQASRQLLQELAERLMVCAANSDRPENYLVWGLILEGDLVGDFTASFPDYEIDWETETWDRTNVSLRLPSAFQLLVYLGDYRGAQLVVDKCPEAFATAGLRGWKAAVRGFVRPEVVVESFEEAAQAFAEDRCPEHLSVGRSWSAINVDLWSPYFRARSLVAKTIREPLKTKDLVAKAAEIFSIDSVGWSHPEAMRFAVLVRSLAQLVGGTLEISWRTVREEFLRTVRVTGEQPGDPLVNHFLTLASDAFAGFVADPTRELTQGRLWQALNVLNRIPLLQEGVAEAIRPAVGDQALNVLYGPVRTWLHRTLESIRDERQLQKIILRLVQASLPAYAQVLHGPLEYGKDVVVLSKEEGRQVLRMYQVKVGDLKTPVWRSARQELEEMFLVPLSEFVVGNWSGIVRRGILMCNGHPLSNVLPSMEGWFLEQKRDHGREFEFMHLDDIVNWIVRDGLVNEFRATLAEIGVGVVAY